MRERGGRGEHRNVSRQEKKIKIETSSPSQPGNRNHFKIDVLMNTQWFTYIRHMKPLVRKAVSQPLSLNSENDRCLERSSCRDRAERCVETNPGTLQSTTRF